MLRCFCLFAISTTLAAAGPVCVSGTLASYEALGAGGCTLSIFSVTNFTFTYVSGLTIPDADITVTPSTGFETVALDFTSSDFSVTGSQSTKYVLGYTWDPGDIRSLEDILNDPVSSPGLAQITTVDCQNAGFSPTCLAPTDTIVVSDNGVSPVPTATVSFLPNLQTLGIQNTIELDADSTGSAEITGFENQLTVPEPSTVAPCLLLAALVFRRLRFQRR